MITISGTEHRNRYYVLALLLIVMVGILLRSVEIVNGNYLFGHDQGRDYLYAYDMVENGHIRLIGAELGAGASGISGVFHGPGYLYLLSIIYILFQGDPIGGIWMMLFFNILALALTYIVGMRISGKGLALTALFLTAVSSSMAAEARFLWNPFPATSLVLLILYVVYLMPRNPRLYFPIALFLAGSTYHFEMAVMVPLIITIVVYVVTVLRLTDRRAYMYAGAAVLSSLAPFIVFEVRHGFQAIHGLVTYIQNPPGNTLMFHLFILRDHAYDYWYNFVGTFFNNAFINYSFLHISLAMLLVYGTWCVLKDGSGDIRKFSLFLLLSPVISWIVMYVLIKNRIWDHYLLHLHSVYIFLFAISFMWFINHKKWHVVYLYAFFIVIFALNGIHRTYRVWKYDFNDTGGTHKIAGKKEVIDAVYADSAGEPFNVMVFSPPIYTYPYDYLFLWHGKKTYGYVPGNKKEGTVYLIVEPDPSNPYSVQGWKDTVVAGGETIFTKRLPSGFEIEKRIW